MKFSTRAQYGLRAMVDIALYTKNSKVCSVREISRKEGLSKSYLERLIAKLKKEKLIKAEKGVKGGYFLAQDPKLISILEITEALEGPINLVPCEEKKCSLEKTCAPKRVWRRVRDEIRRTLNNIKLADLV
ncbi:transcriptional regulator [bacterium (Candidatus Torokbacteria) CG_4_10_14_0_2_um_filter_35_8]|nr:MAG: transcriptional regulator [bacterium (Candidatus Torokbacteria) CG_4_10_14_0_2_um_filter_35_8]